jgi:hypothetical protein
VRLDHISYAAGPEGLAAAVQRMGALLGATFRDGGLHPRFGTRNFVLPLAGGVYVEVVAALEHPAADKAPFGRAVKARSELGGGWLAWVVSVDDIGPVERRLGRTAVLGRRIRPYGVELAWRQIGVLDLLDDPALPFFVQWESPTSQHPSEGADSLPRIDEVEICGSRAEVVTWLGEPVDKGDVAVSWVEGEDAGLVAVQFSTGHGPVRVD